MHSLYLVKFSKGAVEKENALDEAQSILESNGFAGDGGFFSNCKADWFVIGGRWSGVLSDLLKKDKIAEAKAKMSLLLKDEIKKSKDIMDYLSINPHLITDEKKKAELEKIYIDIVGTPFFRDHSHGLADDCVELTPELLKILKKDYAEVEIACVTEEGYLEDETTCAGLKKEDLGDLLVVVDYHN